MANESKEQSEPTRPPWPTAPSEQFVEELESLINRHSQQNGSNTPDFILAEYMGRCLEAFNIATRARSEWHNPNAQSGRIHSRVTNDGDGHRR